MSKKKLVHFKENLTFPFLFQFRYHELQQGFALQGNWNGNFFRNPNPITLELGCGKGEYTVGLARAHPDRNYIGMDVKGARLWRGCRTVKDENLVNAAFIRCMIDHVGYFFAPGEVSEIWITFPDPQPKKENQRLTSARFLGKYSNILKPGGLIHLKTDDRDFYNYTRQLVASSGHHEVFATDDLYQSGTTDDVISFQTYYESIWLGMGKKICYLSFSLQNSK